MKKILSSLCPQATKAFEAVSAAGVITAVAAGSPIALCGLAGLAALALSLKAINDRWDRDEIKKMADQVDLILYEQTKRDEHEKAQQIARLLDLPTEANAAYEGPLVMLANGLHAVIQSQENTIGQLSDLALVVDRIDEVTTDTNDVVHKILEVLTTEGNTLRQELSGKDETITILKQALEEAKCRADQGDKVYKEAYRQAEEEGDINLLNEVTDEEIDRLDKLHEQNLEDSIARRRESAAMNFLKGNIDKAKQRLNEILKQLPNDLDAINRMAHIDQLRGDLADAKARCKLLLKIAGDNQVWQAAAYGNLGLIYQTQGDLDRAEEMLQQALDINQELGRKEGVAAAYGNLGLIYQTQGDLDRAEKMHQQALDINQELGSKQGVAIQYGNLGLIYRTQGDLDRAEKMHLQALDINQELGRKEGMAAVYSNLGLIYQTQGDLDRAEKMHLQSLGISQELGSKEGIAEQYGHLAVIYQKQGDLDLAEKGHLQSLEINQELGSKVGIATQCGNLGLIYQRQGNFDLAEKMHLQALGISQELGSKEGIAEQYGNLGVIYRRQGDLERAEKMHLKSLGIEKELGRKEGMAADYANLGLINHTQGDVGGAKQYLEQSLNLYKEVGIPHMIEQVQGWLNELQKKQQ